ncbi:hypothetical protein TrLO_g7171 [Triparma laevis f. longispina]|uniref:Uncharacterized protein n=1 Tax=Triparma laevis f. longispina TaxID=1714387 RepID=A0A9W7KXB3_9STRA|nr:hypothetical protein TrLO_g7171 [Triparma laevis f. longispina]
MKIFSIPLILSLVLALIPSSAFSLPVSKRISPIPSIPSISNVEMPKQISHTTYDRRALTTLRGGSSTPLSKIGSWYSTSLTNSPLCTKTLTSLFLMTLSFYTGQALSPSPLPLKFSPKTSPLFLLLLFPGLYFPITSHFYYLKISKLLPGRDIFSVLKKSFIGQISYGPIYTAIFFLSQLIPNTPSDMSFLKSIPYALTNNLPSKMINDFFPVWRSGVFYWVTVDILSFRYVPVEYITGFVNVASFFWTVILCIAARG